MNNKTYKKIISYWGVMLFLPLLLIFLFSKIIFNYHEKEKCLFDVYMYDLIKNKVVNDKKNYYKKMCKYEKNIMYNKCKWPFRITLITLIIFLICKITNCSDILFCCFKIFPTLKWPLVKELNETLINTNSSYLLNLPDYFVASLTPVVVFHNIDFSNIFFYCSIVYNLLLFICGFFILKACIGLIGRINRANIIAKELFDKKKKNNKVEEKYFFDIINSPIPNQEKYLLLKEE